MARLIDADVLKKKTLIDRYSGEMFIYLEDLDDAPTVDTKPVVHGRWELWETMGITFARCSVCDATVGEDESISFAFCPYCGSDMRESKEEK